MNQTVIKQFDQYTDREIIDKILDGDNQMFEIIIRRYNSFLYKIGRTYCYDHEDTQDLMQETYVSAYYNLKNFEGRSSFKTWLTKIMLNNCYHKKQKFSFRYESAMHDNESEKSQPMFQNAMNNEKYVLNKELGKILEDALHKIPSDYRIVFTLRELNGFNIAETADVLHISENNVKVRLNRAKAMLRSQIEKLYTPEDIFEFNLKYCDNMVARVMAAIGNK